MAKLRHVIFAIFLVIIMGSLLSVSADAGWDSNYNSGSNWNSSPGWNESSGWSSSSDNNYNHENSSGDLRSSIIYAVVILVILLLAPVLSMINSLLFSMTKSTDKGPVVALEDSSFVHDYDDVVKKYFPEYTEKGLIEHLFKLFINIQTAWMNFDYDTLKDLCTDCLYQSYKMDLDNLKSKHRQNVMYNFCLNAANIREIVEENNIIIIKLFMHVALNDYVIDTNNNQVVRGKANTIIHNQYNMEFVVTKNLMEKCPNCGQALNNKSECEYCHTHISDNYSDFVLSKKDII